MCLLSVVLAPILLPEFRGHRDTPTKSQFSLSLPVLPLSEALSRLSAQTNLELGVDPRLASISMLVQTRNESAESTLAAIASTVGGRWDRTAGRLVLSIDPGAATAKRQQLTRLRKLEILSLLTDLKGQIALSDRKGPSAEQRLVAIKAAIRGLESRTIGLNSLKSLAEYVPGAELLDQIVARLQVEPLLQLRHGERVVYANRPNALQKRLAVDCSESLDHFAADFNVIWKGLHQKATELGTRRESFSIPGVAAFERPAPVSTTSLRILLALSRPDSTFPAAPLFNAELRVADSDGTVLISTEKSYAPNTDLSSSESELTSQTIELSQRADELRKAVVASRSGRPPTPSLRLLDTVLHPVETDPLSVLVGELLSEVSIARNKSLVAWIPDHCFSLLATQASPIRGSEILSKLTFRNGLYTRDADNWMHIEPADIDATLRHSCTRRSLEEINEAAKEKGMVSLRDATRFFMANMGLAASDDLAGIYVQIAGHPTARITSNCSPAWLRFFSNRLPTQTSPMTLSMGDLDTKQRISLLSLLYGAERPYRHRAVLLPDNPDAWRVSLRDIEPTEISQAELENVRIKFRTHDEELIRFGSQMGAGEVVDEASISALKALRRPEGAEGSVSDVRDIAERLRRRDYLWVEVTQRKRIDVRIEWTKSLAYEFVLIDYAPITARTTNSEPSPKSIQDLVGG